MILGCFCSVSYIHGSFCNATNYGSAYQFIMINTHAIIKMKWWEAPVLKALILVLLMDFISGFIYWLVMTNDALLENVASPASIILLVMLMIITLESFQESICCVAIGTRNCYLLCDLSGHRVSHIVYFLFSNPVESFFIFYLMTHHQDANLGYLASSWFYSMMRELRAFGL